MMARRRALWLGIAGAVVVGVAAILAFLVVVRQHQEQLSDCQVVREMIAYNASHSVKAQQELVADSGHETDLTEMRQWADQLRQFSARITDDALVYRHGTNWGWVCTAWGLRCRFIKPGHPWTNGKAERFNRTLLTEWAYARPWTSNSLRTRGLDRFLHRYNTQRGHSALGGHPPSAGSPPDNNVSGHDI